MADFDQSVERTMLCVGMGLGIVDGRPDLRRLSLRGHTVDGQQVEVVAGVTERFVADLRVNLIGRLVMVETDERGQLAKLRYSEETGVPDHPPPDDTNWTPLFRPPDDDPDH